MQGVKAGFAKVNQMFNDFKGQAATLALGIAAATGAAALGLIDLAAHAAEAGSKLDAVFGDQAANVRNFADEYAKHVGRSKNEVRGMTTDFAALAKGMGFASVDAAKLGQQLTAAAYDAASFHDKSDEQAFIALRSAISGEAEPLKQFGIVLNDVALNAQLMKMGIMGGSEAASEQQKVLARVAIIQAKLNEQNATGDLARTGESVSNSWKRLKGEALDLGVAIGEQLLPLAKELIEAFRMAIGATGGISQGFLSAQGTGTAALKTLVEWIKAVVIALANWDLGAKLIGVSMAETFINAWGRVKWFGEQTKIFLVWLFENWRDVFADIGNIVVTVFQNMVSNISNIMANLPDLITGKMDWSKVWTPMLDGFKSSIKQMPEFTKFQAADFSAEYKEIDKEWQKRMDAMQSKVKEPASKAIQDVTSLNTTIDKNQGTPGKATSKEAKFVDIASIFKNAQESLTKGKEAKMQQDMLAAQQRTADAAEKQLALQRGEANKPAVVVPT